MVDSKQSVTSCKSDIINPKRKQDHDNRSRVDASSLLEGRERRVLVVVVVVIGAHAKAVATRWERRNRTGTEHLAGAKAGGDEAVVPRSLHVRVERLLGGVVLRERLELVEAALKERLGIIGVPQQAVVVVFSMAVGVLLSTASEHSGSENLLLGLGLLFHVLGTIVVAIGILDEILGLALLLVLLGVVILLDSRRLLRSGLLRGLLLGHWSLSHASLLGFLGGDGLIAASIEDSISLGDLRERRDLAEIGFDEIIEARVGRGVKFGDLTLCSAVAGAGDFLVTHHGGGGVLGILQKTLVVAGARGCSGGKAATDNGGVLCQFGSDRVPDRADGTRAGVSDGRCEQVKVNLLLGVRASS